MPDKVNRVPLGTPFSVVIKRIVLHRLGRSLKEARDTPAGIAHPPFTRFNHAYRTYHRERADGECYPGMASFLYTLGKHFLPSVLFLYFAPKPLKYLYLLDIFSVRC